jgi:hypothetical protein
MAGLFGSRASRSSSTSGFAQDASGVQNIRLEDMPRRSTETTRRNGFAQSQAADHPTRILEDIKN